MAECTLVRCSQEKRFFRKEFNRWGRNILYVVGLERIAEEYMGKQKWKNFALPFKDEYSEDPGDWSPDETCHFCQAKKAPLFDPASGVLHDDQFRNELDDHSVSSDQGINGGGSSNSLRCNRGQRVNDQPLDLSTHSKHKHSVCNGFLQPHSHHHHHSGSDEASDSGISGSSCFLKVPHIPVKPGSRRRFDPNGKKSYTEDELQAALRDIQSGKLGTRRAAVIYGIPRSTLRNKVYKMAMEKDKKNIKTVKIKSTGEETTTGATGDKIIIKKEHIKTEQQDDLIAERSSNDGNVNSSASESLRQLLKQTITQKSQFSGNRKIISGREEEVINRTVKRPSLVESSLCWPVNQETLAAFNSLNTTDYSHSINPLLTQVLANIQHLALAKGAADVNDLRDLVACNTKKEDQFSLLPEMIRRLAEEQLELECERRHNNNEEGDDATGGGVTLENELWRNRELNTPANFGGGGHCTTTAAEAALSNVILKIPSYKPTKFSSTANNSAPPPPNFTSKNGGGNVGCHGDLPFSHSLPRERSPSENSVQTNSTSSQNSGNKGITVSLKELIARSINQKMRGSSTSGGSGAICTVGGILTDELNTISGGKIIDSSSLSCNALSKTGPTICTTNKRYYSSDNDETDTQCFNNDNKNGGSSLASGATPACASDLSSDSLHKSEKRTRPKRGRYRNYDTDNLAQAVRAVQRGEMSVHRAGTYFGVPHSTLEYKVKERHLLRPKKRDGGGHFKNSNPGGASHPGPGGSSVGGNNINKSSGKKDGNHRHRHYSRGRVAGEGVGGALGKKTSARLEKYLKNRRASPNGALSSSQPEDEEEEDEEDEDEDDDEEEEEGDLLLDEGGDGDGSAFTHLHHGGGSAGVDSIKLEHDDHPRLLQQQQQHQQLTSVPTLLPSHLSLWQNMPFFPMDLTQVTSNGFFASQMMKKLQENVRLQEEIQKQDKNNRSSTTTTFNLHPGSTLHGMGILESLIKSTLEKSIPSESRNSLDSSSSLSIPSARSLLFPEVSLEVARKKV